MLKLSKAERVKLGRAETRWRPRGLPWSASTRGSSVRLASGCHLRTIACAIKKSVPVRQCSPTRLDVTRHNSSGTNHFSELWRDCAVLCASCHGPCDDV